ncbi:ClpXP protease specificity-enhancing factor SspB [uncultured Sulfitobacter sp.]|uniref:SspB family protein n=1 Tax=uncultured Sulfitobacter sp. TaxID=191468 RepID=UPI002610A66F|nr:ClpXP protease specificity-enhancing factor SspB [uncultured Sulfitobacter sp.]
MSRSIDYGNLMHDAMRSLIRNVLLDVADNGLPGAHHFFITFDTSHPDAELADWLSDRYPDEMTVVMQHWYDNLEVTEDGFSITLNFGDAPEPLYIPYDAIRTFVDPSVEFGLRFEQQEEGAESRTGDASKRTDSETLPQTEESQLEVEESPAKAAEIVSLDSFRKT